MGQPLRLSGFSGLAPRINKRLLADNQAQVATNCRLTDGQVAPLRDPLLANIPGVTGVLSMYRAVLNAVEAWLAWNVDVDVERGPIAGDTLGRIYWSGQGEPRMSQFSDYTNGGGPYPSLFYVLGVTPPVTAPTLAIVGGASATNETRAYCYAFQTQFGEQSQPSPACAVQTGKIDASWNLSNMDAAPPNSVNVSAGTWASGTAQLTVNSVFGMRVGETLNVASVNPTGYNANGVTITAIDTATKKISYALASNPGAYVSGGTMARVAPHNTTGMVKNIYRTITATNGDTQFRFVASIAVATTTYADTIASTVVASQELLASTNYEMPPVDMKGMISLANGIMAGFSKNQVCLSVPFQPHAYPSVYRQTVPYNIVAIGYFGTTIVAGTEGPPYTMSGVDPSTMGGGMESLKVEWPCLSKRGMVSTPFGVMYPAPQGLALIGVSGPDIVTRPFFTQEEWAKLNPSTFIASMRDNKYYAAYTQGSFNYILIVDKSEFAAVTLGNYKAAELWTDLLSGKLYVVQNDTICEFDAAGSVNSLFDWMSKEFTFGKPQNFAAAKIDADFTMTETEIANIQAAVTAAIAANQAIINSGVNFSGAFGVEPIGLIPIGMNALGDVPDAVYDQLTFELYCDNKLICSRKVSSRNAFRLPAGYECDNATIRVAGNVRVTSIKLATTMKGLEEV